MKTAKLCTGLGWLIAGLLGGGSPARAQPASGAGADARRPASSAGAPAPADGVASNDGAASDDDAPSDDDSALVDDPRSPWNQGVSLEDRRAARALLREGTRLYLVPLYARAAEQYEAALRKWQHPGLYYNLALTQRNLGKESDALATLERALQYGEKPLGSKRFRQAQKQLADLKRLLGRLRVTCQVPGAEVTLDGGILFTGPGSYEGWVKAKSHELTAKKAGYLSEARRVTVASDQLQEVDLRLITLSQATDAGRRWAAWKPWAVAAAGGALGIAGAGLHVLASRNFNDYDARFGALDCAKGNPPPGCPKDYPGLAALNDQLHHARQEQLIAVGGYVLGGALVTTGIVLLYMNRARLVEQGESRSSTERVSLAPAVSGEMLGVLVNVNH